MRVEPMTFGVTGKEIQLNKVHSGFAVTTSSIYMTQSPHWPCGCVVQHEILVYESLLFSCLWL